VKNQFLIASLGAAVLLLLLGCGGGGGGGAAGRDASVSLLVGDAPTDSLSSFEMTLLSVTLIRADGSDTGNLLATPRSIDLLALRTSSSLVGVVTVPPGSYTGALLTFDPTTIVARDKSGAPVALQVNQQFAAGTFTLPVALERDDRVKLHFEFLLDDSLTADGSGGFIFSPVLAPTHRSGFDDVLDEVHGLLVSASAANGTLRVDLSARDDSASHGALTIAVDASTLLVGDDGNLFSSSAAFFAFLLAGDRIEATGGLRDDGVLRASFLHVERDDGGAAVARIEGTITALDVPGELLVLRLRSIQFGSSVVNPVLDSLGNPAEIEVDFAASEIELRGSNPRSGTSADLMVGQEVHVDFSAFATAPFPARSIEIESEEPEFEGTIVDASGIPAQIVIHLDESDPAILDGRVASTHTDVFIDLDGSERLYLDLSAQPAIAVDDLRNNLRVRVRGILSGSPTIPQIAASEVRVRPGRLKGVVIAADGTAGSFDVDVDRVDDPFGGADLPDPVGAVFAAGARVTSDASSVNGFFAAFDALTDGQTLEVELFGLADGTGGAVTHELDVRLKK